MAEQWVPVATVQEIPEGSRKVVKIRDVPIAVFHLPGDRWTAIQNVCPHRGGPVGEGVLDGSVVQCPWHGWRFDVMTGVNAANPASSVGCFDVKVEGREVFVNQVPKGAPGGGLGRP